MANAVKMDCDANGNASVKAGFTISTGLSAVDDQRVDTLLDKCRDVFASPGNTGCCTIVEHALPLTPISCLLRRLPTRGNRN